MGNPFTSGPSLLLKTKEERALQCGIVFPTYFPIYVFYIHVPTLHNADSPIFPGFSLVA